MQRVAIVGAGTVGSTAAFNIAVNDLCDELVLIDLDEEKAHAEALDISHAVALESHTRIVQGNYEDAEDVDLVIVTAGKPRAEGMTRLDLAEENAAIIRDIFAHFEGHEPVFLTTTNPMDVMNYVASQTLDIPRERFLGFGGWLDSARFQFLLAQHLDVAADDVMAYVIGQHGENQVPVFSHVTVRGEKINVERAEQERIHKELKASAMEVIKRKGGTEWGPGRGLSHIARAILTDERTLIPCSAVLDGEYNTSGMSIGVPCIIGKNGIEEIIEWELTEREEALFREGVETLQEFCATFG